MSDAGSGMTIALAQNEIVVATAGAPATVSRRRTNGFGWFGVSDVVSRSQLAGRGPVGQERKVDLIRLRTRVRHGVGHQRRVRLQLEKRTGRARKARLLKHHFRAERGRLEVGEVDRS